MEAFLNIKRAEIEFYKSQGKENIVKVLEERITKTLKLKPIHIQLTLL